MKIRGRIKRVIPLLFLVWSGCQMATVQKLEEFGMVLSPENCFLTKSQQICSIDITASWYLESPNDYCLFVSTQTAPLKCWINQKSGKITAHFEVNESVKFTLKAADGPFILEKRLTLYRQVKNLRKKRRNPWSFY
jgi:hypothetical protein